MNLDHQTGLVVKTHSTSMIDDELINIINNLGKRCYIHTKRIDHPPGRINKNTTIETLGTISDKSLIDICIKHFPKGVKKVLLYDIKETNLEKTTVGDIPIDFVPAEYLRLNPDIVKGGFNTEALAVQHWRQYGHKEGRLITSSELLDLDKSELIATTNNVNTRHYELDQIYLECLDSTDNLPDNIEMMLSKLRDLQQTTNNKLLHVNIDTYEDLRYAFLSHLYIYCYYLDINKIIVTLPEGEYQLTPGISYVSRNGTYTDNCNHVRHTNNNSIIYHIDMNPYKTRSYMLYCGYHLDTCGNDNNDYNFLHYCVLNSDFNPTGTNNVCSYRYLLNHWIDHGRNEGREAKLPGVEIPTLELDQLNIDHIIAPDQITWINNMCLRLGREGCTTTNVNEPLNYNVYKQLLGTTCDISAIFNIFKNNRNKHVTKYNIPESFSINAYHNLNIDLPRNWTPTQLVEHFMNVRKIENRLYRYTNDNYSHGIYLLVNHDASLTGAPIYLYNLALTLQAMGINVMVLDTYPTSNNTLKDKLNNPVHYYYNSASLLKAYIDKLEPLCLYMNSFSLVMHDYKNFEDHIDNMLFHLHETADLYIKHFNSNRSGSYLNELFERIKNNKILVVSETIKKQYLKQYPYLKIDVAPPYLTEETIQLIDNATSQKNKSTGTNTRLTLGMVGDPSERKGVDIFIQVAKNTPEVDFVWVGGKKLPGINLPCNLKHIKNTPNPYKHYVNFDYTFVTSRSDPCPYIILESFYTETPCIYLPGNITYNHEKYITEKNLYIPLENHGNDPDCISKQLNKMLKDKTLKSKAEQTNVNILREYILNEFTHPKQFNF